MKNFSLIATCAFGLEAVLKREIQALGYDARIQDNKIYFTGDWRAIVQTNLWLRTADHVKIEMARFKATTFEELFSGVKKIPWEIFIPYEGKFIVDGQSVKSQLFSISDCQSITEKAIVERLKTEFPNTDYFPKDGARYKIKVSLLRDIATVTLDTTGESLHKRGYRKNQGAAPLKETMAAGMVLLSFYNKDRFLFDPFCGSGTILIEAAMIAKNIAPGLNRKFDFEQWDIFPRNILEEEKIRARKCSRPNLKLNILGADNDPKMVKIAVDNIMKMGLSEDIKITGKDFREVDLVEKYGVLITNPPYGKRIFDEPEVNKLMKDLGARMETLPTWSFYIISGDENLEKTIGRKADRKRKFFNGNIRTDYYQFYGERPPKKER